MKAMTVIDLMRAWSKLTRKPCMFIQFDDDANLDEVIKAAPYLGRSTKGCDQILVDSCGVLAFDSREEMEDAFAMTVGDDGPTKLNPYSGPARVYALTCVAGQLRNENT